MTKRIFAALLASALLLSLCACGQESNDPGKGDGTNEDFSMKAGLVDNIIDFGVYDEHLQADHANSDIPAIDTSEFFVIYPNLTTAMLALEKGEVDMLSLSKSTADYMVAHNDKFTLMSMPLEEGKVLVNKISMLTTDTNTELYEILNSGIKQLKENGTMDRLIEEDLKAFITSDPTPSDLPTFEDAPTYKIAVTGDRPPMDFVTADGKAAGFNVALLTEIANIAQVNFEIVQVDSEARLTALASGNVDAVFWVATVDCMDCEKIIGAVPAGTLMTEDYFSEEVAFLVLK